MRTIKFRGRESDDNWCYGSLIQYKSGEVAIANFERYGNECSTMSRTIVAPATVGQFTGLTDKNGKEIYEGDIVAHPYIDPIFGDLVEMKDGKGVKSVVVFHEGAFCVRYGEDEFYYLDQFTRHKHIEVVGNISDNAPERLKGDEI